MLPEFKVAPEFKGPALSELLPILPDIPADIAVEARWGGLKQDYIALEKAGDRKLVLVVPDAETQERTLWSLGGALPIKPEELETARRDLGTPALNVNWRVRLMELGHSRGTMLLCKIMSSGILAGRRSRPETVAIARECLLDHLDPTDADVLMRLRAAQW